MMTLQPTEPSKQPNSATTPIPTTSKFSKKQLALAFAIAGISDAIRSFRDPFAADRVGGGSWDGAAAVHGVGPAMAAVAGTGSGGNPGFGGASVIAAGRWRDCSPGHSS